MRKQDAGHASQQIVPAVKEALEEDPRWSRSNLPIGTGNIGNLAAHFEAPFSPARPVGILNLVDSKKYPS